MFFGMEFTQNGGGLLFRIFEYVIWFCWVFTERVKNRMFGHNWLYECSCSFAWFSKNISNSATENISIFLASQIYLQRLKRFLSKKMKLKWNEVLSFYYLNSINYWSTLADLQKVIPLHANRYKQIVLNSAAPPSCIAPHDLSFATSFIVAVLLLMVKVSRPMTYKHLIIEMIKSIGANGIINQTFSKTNEKYGFGSLLFPVDVLSLVTVYTTSFKSSL